MVQFSKNNPKNNNSSLSETKEIVGKITRQNNGLKKGRNKNEYQLMVDISRTPLV
jgi:hypothetical protein